MFKKTLALCISLAAVNAYAVDTPIIGQVESKCVVTSDKQGVMETRVLAFSVLMQRTVV